ncbi:HK97 family phage prohead protease [Sphingomonas olei]
MLDAWDSPFEIKSVDDAGLIEGLAAGFGDVDLGGDKLLFGAMTKTLEARQGRPLPMLLHHDQRRPVGAWKEWRETPDGLMVKGAITTSTRDGQEARDLVRSGAITGISIGFVGDQKARFEGKVRVLPEVELYEASLVAIPMHPRARVSSLKSIAGAGDIADILREAGLSGRQAKAAAGAAWRAINTNETEDEAEVAAILKASAARISGKSFSPAPTSVGAGFDWS